MAKLNTNEYVSLEVIDKICEALNCQPGELLEYIGEEQKSKKDIFAANAPALYIGGIRIFYKGVNREMEENSLWYPIGQFVPRAVSSEEERKSYTKEIADIVPSLRKIVKDFNHDQFQTPYRSGGWTVQQVVHHMADNDINASLRLKRALTEEEPMASSYHPNLWAELTDYKDTPIEISLMLLEALHYRLIHVIHGLKPTDFDRRFNTEVLGWITVDVAIQRFIWHNRHHTSHIQSLAQRMNW
ncbi:YfiT family bacillithiol transferase [Paenibacillus elgii]